MGEGSPCCLRRPLSPADSRAAGMRLRRRCWRTSAGAAVSRNAFYANFADKQACFAAAHEACHERLLAILEQPCERGSSVEERVETSLGAALDMLATEPEVARLLFVEAPSSDQVIVGGIASRVASEVLKGGTAELRSLTPHLVEYVLTFYGPGRPDPRTGKVVALEPEQPPEYVEEQRKQAGA